MEDGWPLPSPVSAWDHGDFDTAGSQGYIEVFNPLAGITVFNGAKFLEEADDGVACFCECELLADAYT